MWYQRTRENILTSGIFFDSALWVKGISMKSNKETAYVMEGCHCCCCGSSSSLLLLRTSLTDRGEQCQEHHPKHHWHPWEHPYHSEGCRPHPEHPCVITIHILILIHLILDLLLFLDPLLPFLNPLLLFLNPLLPFLKLLLLFLKLLLLFLNPLLLIPYWHFPFHLDVNLLLYLLLLLTLLNMFLFLLLLNLHLLLFLLHIHLRYSLWCLFSSLPFALPFLFILILFIPSPPFLTDNTSSDSSFIIPCGSGMNEGELWSSPCISIITLKIRKFSHQWWRMPFLPKAGSQRFPPLYDQ